MRSYKTEAIVIKRRNSNEADRILTVFTKNGEKIIVKAKGVRRITSRRSSHIELLNHSLLTLYRTQSSQILTEAQMIESFQDIKKSLINTGYAYHMCELIDGLCPEGVREPYIFYLFHKTLSALEGQDESIDLLHNFEIGLLTTLGYWHKPKSESIGLDTHNFIESILERKLKSHKIFAKL